MNTPRASVIAALDRIDPGLGAFITFDRDLAIRAAADAPSGRLSGTVIAVKDLIDVAGLPTTFGSPLRSDRLPVSTAPAVAGLVEQGAIVVGKTNLNEFAFGVTGYNPHFGPVLNPLDRRRTAGGSSGGSAAAVASGACELAIGTDTSGSVRLPAACCGVWGLKCAAGLDMSGIHPLAPSFDSLGYLASEPDVLQKVLGLDVLPDVAGLSVGEVGVDLEVPDLPPEHWTIFRSEARAVHRRQLERGPDSFGADLRLKMSLPLGDLDDAWSAEHAWRKRFAAAVAGVDVIVRPVMDGAAPLLSETIRDYERGESLVTDRLLRHTPVANALGWPALAFPSADGAREVLGRPGREAELLSVARKLSGQD